MDITPQDKADMIEAARGLRDGEYFEYRNVTIEKKHGRWFTQEKNGGTQYSKSPKAAVQKLIALVRAQDAYRQYRRSL